jgi:hypothetical protein
MSISRLKCLTTRLSDDEYAALEHAAGARPLSAWARDTLVAAAHCGSAPTAPSPSAPAVVIAEIVALRTVLLNLEYAHAVGDVVTLERLQALIAQSDQERFARAAERLAEAAEEGVR